MKWSSIVSDIADATQYHVSLNCVNNCNDCNKVAQKEGNETETTLTNLCYGANYQISIVPLLIITVQRIEYKLQKKYCNTMMIETLPGGKMQDIKLLQYCYTIVCFVNRSF